MSITCRNCNFEDFYVRDGAYFCEQCHKESADHGRETVLDEASFSAFGTSASTLKSRKIGNKRKKRKRDSDQDRRISFTTVDAYTYILTAWVEELITLGSNPTLKQIVFTIWARYLQHLGMAFTEYGREPGLSSRPTFRDIQVKLFGRKKMIHVQNVAKLRRRRTKPLPKDESSSDDNNDENSAEARRKRKRKRREFFKSIADETSDSANDSSASFSSFGSSASFISNTSLNASSINASDSSYCEEEPVDEDEKKEQHARILERVSVHILGKAQCGTTDASELSLKTVLCCLILGVLCNEDNVFTISDIDFWISTGALSYLTATKNIPSHLKLDGREDVLTFTPGGISQSLIRKVVFDLACRLDLGEVDFNCQGNLKKVMDRYLKEFSLLVELREMVFKALRPVPELLEVHQKFPNVAPRQTCFMPMASVDVRCLALILFALKYLYVLDDCSEEFISSSLRQSNLQKSVNEAKSFVICDWIKLSRMIVFLAVKHSVILNKRLAVLCPNVELTDSVRVESFFLLSEKIILIKSNVSQGEYLTNREKNMYASLKEELTATFGCLSVKRSKLDLLQSDTPLLHFAAFCLKNPGEILEQGNYIAEIERLLEMHNSRLDIGMNCPELNTVNIAVPWKLGTILPPKREQGRSTNDPWIDYSQERVKPLLPDNEKCYRIIPTYWRLKPRMYKFTKPKHFNKLSTREEVLCSVPEGFRWILEYFAAHSGIPITEIYAELVFLEETIVKYDKKYFGKVRLSKSGKIS